VSTPIGVDGIASGEGDGVGLAKSEGEFAERMIEMIDPTTNTRFGAAALRHYEKHFSERAVFSRYDDVFQIDGPRS
jgi:hypothetical protein